MKGWTGDKCDRDVNECDTMTTQQECQHVGASCVNLQGGYNCECQNGYQKQANGTCQGNRQNLLSLIAVVVNES